MGRTYHKHQCTIKDGIYWHKLKINHKSEFGKNEHKKEISSYKQDMKEYRTAKKEIKEKGGKIRKYGPKIIISGGLLSLVSLLAILNAIPGVTSSGLNDFYCDEVCEIPFTVCTSKYDLDLRGRQIQPFYFDKNVTLERIINNEDGKHFTFNNNILRKGKCWNLTAIVKKEEFETIKYGFKIGDMDIDPLLLPSKEYKPDLNYNVSDIDKNIKKINVKISDKTLSDVENKIYQGDLINLKKTNYFGDANIVLKAYKNITKERVKRSYDCNCRNETYNETLNEIINQTLNETINETLNGSKENKTIEKVREVCDTCYEYENYTEEIMREINPETFVLKKDIEIFEVFEGCSKIEKLPDGKWGCKVWTDINILGQNIEGASWFNESWDYTRNITINSSKINGNLTDFPLMLSITQTTNIKSGGADVRFTDSDGNLLPREIEIYNGSGAGVLVVHILANLSSTSDTVLSMYYGNSNASEPLANSIYGSEAVWDSDFIAVHLMNNLLDSTGNSHSLTAYGSPSVASMDYGVGYDLDGSTQYFSMADHSDWDLGTSSLTFEVLLDLDSLQNMQMIGWRGGYNPLFRVSDNTGFKLLNYYHNVGIIQYGDSIIGVGYNYLGETRLSDTHMVYLNGSKDDSSWVTSGPTSINSIGVIDVGIYQGGGFKINGRYGQLRISKVSRSADYLNATNKNLKNPSATGTEPFYSSFGAEETQEETTFNITLNSPANETVTSDSTPDFNFTVIGSESSYECELFINGSGYGKATNWCYQETANVFTACGGLDTGSYSAQNYYFYINYTKPSSALNLSLWKVKHGWNGTHHYNENITLPLNCWSQNPLQLRIKSSGGQAIEYTQPQCYNGSHWNNIGSTNTCTQSTAIGGMAAPLRLYDGLWATGVCWDNWGGGNWYEVCNHCGRINEEAMWWNMNLNNTPTIITANQSLSDGNYNWYINCTADSVTNQSEVREITIDTNISIETGIFDIIKTGTTLGGKALIRVKNTI